jgi:riboflavin biosynthesis pyrimidine reductase
VTGPALEPLEVAFERGGLPAFALPGSLAGLYGGTLGFSRPAVFANFVSTIDGVVALPDVSGGSSAMLGGATRADRFVMALLRACAGSLLVGASTFRGARVAGWTAERFWPTEAASFGELRRSLGLGATPELAVLTRSGELDVSHPALEEGALVLTTQAGAGRLQGRLPGAATLAVLGQRHVTGRAAIAYLRGRGHDLILTEGGPTLLGTLVADGIVDELFLTISPLLAGRDEDGRPGLIDGIELLPGRMTRSQLLGVRRSDDYLFLRYAVTAWSQAGPEGSGSYT